MTRISRLLIALVALVWALTGCGVNPPPSAVTPSADASSDEITIGLTYIPNIQFAPFYVAEAEGAFTKQGLQATLRHHGAQEGLFTALASGQEDYVIAGGDEMVQARAEGMDLVAIGQYYRSYPVVLIVPDVSDITTAADLRGHSIGVPGRYGESWFGLQAALAEAGLTEADVTIVEIGYTAQAALTTGKVDAVVGFSNNDQVQFGLAGVPTRVVPLSSGEVPLVSIVLVTTAEHVRTQPQTARKVAAAMLTGIERTVAAPASAIEAAKTHIPTMGQPGAEASALATLEATIPLWTGADGTVSGRLDPAAWEAMTRFMLDKGLIRSAVDPAAAMTNDVVESQER